MCASSYVTYPQVKHPAATTRRLTCDDANVHRPQATLSRVRLEARRDEPQGGRWEGLRETMPTSGQDPEGDADIRLIVAILSVGTTLVVTIAALHFLLGLH